MNMFRTLLWDFDGVIFDSMPVREAGFRHIFQSFPAHQVEKLIEYHQENGGMSRYLKIRYFYEQILGTSIGEAGVTEHAQAYSEYMMNHMLDETLCISETVELIQSLHGMYPMHVVSGSDGMELRSICAAVGLDRYFLSITGSPRVKTLLVEDVLKEYGYDRSSTCLIGDSKNDRDAAIANGITFIGYNNSTLRDGGIYLEQMGQLERFLP